MLENNIKNLIKILEESTIDDMEVSTFWGKQRIRLRKQSTSHTENNIEIIKDKSVETSVAIDPVPPSKELDNESVQLEKTASAIKDFEHDDTICIKAPLVGTFYRSSKPEDPPFISEGDNIIEGQVICIIEAMKIFNEIESEFSGKVRKILINDSMPVEYDQDLFVISPE